MAHDVRAALASLQPSLPRGVHLRVVYDQSELIDDALGGVGRAVLIGALFVVLVIAFLLGQIRAAALVTLTMPLSILIAGVLLLRLEVGLNTMTLGGLAIAVGLLVDASIIVVENIVHHLSKAPLEKRHESAVEPAVEVGRPIAFATLIIAAVFLPLFSITGIEGRMYAPLAVAVVSSMAAALILALTFTPPACAWLLARAKEVAEEPAWLARLKVRYARALDAILARPARAVVVTVALAVPGLALALVVGGDFMPALDEGALMLNTIAPPEASLEETDLLNRRAEDALRGIPEVADVARRTGRGEETEDAMPHSISDLLVVPKRDRSRTASQIEDEVRERVARVPGIAFLFTTPLLERIDESLGGTPADVAVRIYGPDLDELARLGAEAKAIVRKVDGVDEVRTERLVGLPQVQIRVDRAACARAGITPGHVVEAIRTGLVGQQVGEVRRGPRRFDLVVLLDDRARGDLNAIRRLLVDVPDDPTARRVPLGELALIEQTTSPGTVKREAGSRRIAVEASVGDDGADLQSVAHDVRRALDEKLALPTGYFLDVGGKVESAERAQRSLLFAGLIAAVLVFSLLYVALGRARDALVLVLTVPVAVVGGVLGLLASGETWNVSSLVGLIGLFGIAVQNGLVLMTQVNDLEREGRSRVDAVREASIGRVRPKLMTAATAILGLLPLLVLRLHGTEVERPLAIVISAGLVTSTVFTLFVLPAVLALTSRTTR